jgi:hypothetical protein
MRVQITARMCATILAHLLNIHGYLTYCQEYGENFIILLGVLYLEVPYKLMPSLSSNRERVCRHADTHELDDASNLLWNPENTVKQSHV